MPSFLEAIPQIVPLAPLDCLVEPTKSRAVVSMGGCLQESSEDSTEQTEANAGFEKHGAAAWAGGC